jgi:sugar lactone lactonase YvrE
MNSNWKINDEGAFSMRILLLLILGLALAMGATAWGDADLQVVAEVDAVPANLTVDQAGNIYVTFMPFFDPEPHLIRIDPAGKRTVYPNTELSQGVGKEHLYLDSPLGMQVDRNGVLWILDSGVRSGLTQKVVAWDTQKNELHRVIHLPEPILFEDSFINDLAVDLDHGAIYISDSGAKCIVVIDLKTGNARHVLHNHTSMLEEKEKLIIDGRPILAKNEDGSVDDIYIPINPLAADAQNEYVYWGPLTGYSLYRIKTAYLRDFSLSDSQLAGYIERYSDKPHCDGIGIDRAGNIYITDLANNAIGAITTDKQYRTLVKNDKILRWPDSISYGPDGYFYTLAHQIHLTARMNAGEDRSSSPFYIVKFKGLAPGVIGR